MKFTHRSYERELMDEPALSAEDFHINLREITYINRFLGGANVTYEGVKALLKDLGEGSIEITDIGAGGGDLFDYLSRQTWHRPIKYVAVDIQPEAKTFAQQAFPHLNGEVVWRIGDYKDLFEQVGQTDIVTANLFCHHLDERCLKDFLRGALNYARVGVVINDLHRHPIAYYAIRGITALVSKSKFTKNDAPLSVLRGFRASEWRHMLNSAGITAYDLRWRWAFRHLIVIPKVKNR